MEDIASPSAHKSPFRIEGAHNVILETIKRAEDDVDAHKRRKNPGTTVILRLYEAYGGHSKATLRIASHLSVQKASIANLLEHSTSALTLEKDKSTDDTVIALKFRGFEILTVKLLITSVAQLTYVLSFFAATGSMAESGVG